MGTLIHRDHFMGGRMTPREFNAGQYPERSRCLVCDRKPMVMGRVLMPVADYRKRDPLFDMTCALRPDIAFKRIVQIDEGDGRGKPYVIVSTVYACDSHRTHLEVAIAKAPSWCIGEIWAGPNPTNRVVSGRC